jgi:hypothetical protein
MNGGGSSEVQDEAEAEGRGCIAQARRERQCLVYLFTSIGCLPYHNVCTLYISLLSQLSHSDTPQAYKLEQALSHSVARNGIARCAVEHAQRDVRRLWSSSVDHESRSTAWLMYNLSLLL